MLLYESQPGTAFLEVTSIELASLVLLAFPWSHKVLTWFVASSRRLLTIIVVFATGSGFLGYLLRLIASLGGTAVSLKFRAASRATYNGALTSQIATAVTGTDCTKKHLRVATSVSGNGVRALISFCSYVPRNITGFITPSDLSIYLAAYQKRRSCNC